ANLKGQEERLGVCWARKSLAKSAGLHAGLVDLQNGPACQDFNETICDAGTTYDANSNGCINSIVSPDCGVSIEKEIFITDPSVVDDPIRTSYVADAGAADAARGAFTIKNLFENFSEGAPDRVDDFLTSFTHINEDGFDSAPYNDWLNAKGQQTGIVPGLADI